MIERIAINIYHPEVTAWRFTERQADLLVELLPKSFVWLCHSQEEFLEALPEAECALVWNFRQEWFARAPKLKIISTPAAGKDYFHVTPPAGVQMMYGRFHGEIIGETVVGMLLGMCRGLTYAVTNWEKESWPRREMDSVQRTLRGSRVTIVGFGNIGRWIGKLLKPFGVQVTGICHTGDRPRPEWFDEEDRIVGISELNQVLLTTDHVILALPGGEETHHLLDESRLKRLPRGATLINIGRGNSVEEQALSSLLESGRLSGAFLDVFSEEPLPMNSPLRNCPHLWRLPHASAISPNYLDLYVKDFVKQLEEQHFV